MGKPIIWWVRRDLRLADNPVLDHIIQTGRPVVPVYVLDPLERALGAAPKFRLGLGLQRFAQSLAALGVRLILRQGDALSELKKLVREVGAHGVVWSRLYTPEEIGRDRRVKENLTAAGVVARSFGGRLLFEPWTVQTKTGGPYRVFTPYWKTVRARDVGPPVPPPTRVPAPQTWPSSEALPDWNLSCAMHRGADIVTPHCRVGETAAHIRLETFLHDHGTTYAAHRDFPARATTSGLSENLTWGEISPRQIWHRMLDVQHQHGTDLTVFAKELVWREFAAHLTYHTPHILCANWRPQWDEFPWKHQITPEVRAWQRGQTGYDLVDAGMRELYVTGRMHNRVRMVVASFLCKHLGAHWSIGQEWFRQCLVDWDPASNALGWQWVAGSGPDAAPFFRIFNPEGQRGKFDADGAYCRQWLAEGHSEPPPPALTFFEAVPTRWQLDPHMPRAAPIVDLSQRRLAALAAYEHMRSGH